MPLILRALAMKIAKNYIIPELIDLSLKALQRMAESTEHTEIDDKVVEAVNSKRDDIINFIKKEL